MRAWIISRRTAKEILRDPLSLAFGIGFPVVLLALFALIQASVPIRMFEPENLTPGIAVFGLSFVTLFTALLLAKDRSSALLQRLYTTPLTARDFVFGYTLPMIPISVCQVILCYTVSMPFGLTPSVRIIPAVLLTAPVCLFYIALGLLFGSILTDNQVGGICGALVTTLSGWLAGAWFDLKAIGGAIEKIAYALPLVHAVELGKSALSGSYDGVGVHLAWVLGYSVLAMALAIPLFIRQMKRQ